MRGPGRQVGHGSPVRRPAPGAVGALAIRWAVRWLRNPEPRRSVAVLRLFGAQVGEGVTVKGPLHLDNVWHDEHSAGDFSHLSIGDNAYIGDGAYFDLAHEVHIGRDAVLAAQVRVITHLDVNRSPYLREQLPRVCEPVRIGTGASVSFGATLLAGSVMDEESALAAGAVLLQRRCVPRRTVWGGVPARQLRTLEP